MAVRTTNIEDPKARGAAAFAILPFLAGLLSVAPLRLIPTEGEDLTLFPTVLATGVLAGGLAFFALYRGLGRCSRRSALSRWAFFLMLWSLGSFLCYPVYALVFGLPLDFLRSAQSAAVTATMSLYFFLGLRWQRDARKHVSYFLGTIVAAALYLGFLGYILNQLGLLSSPDLIGSRAALVEYVPGWPSRFPVVLIQAAFVALAILRRFRARLVRILLTVLALVFSLAALYSLTRGALIGLAVAVILMLVYRVPGRWLALGIAMVLLLYAAGTSFQQRIVATIDPSGELENSSAMRIQIWLASARAIAQSPLFGYGQQGTGTVLGEVETRYETASGFAAHNDFVDVAVRSGLPGLFAYLLMCWSVWRFGLRFGKKNASELAFISIGLLAAFSYGMFHELLRMPFAGSLTWYLTGAIASEQVASAGSFRAMRGVRAIAQAA